jgi:hypothetical protein
MNKLERIKLRGFGIRILRRIFEPKREEVTGGFRKLHNQEVLVMCYSPNRITVFQPRRTIFSEYVVHMEEMSHAYEILVGTMKERDHLRDPGVDGRIAFNWFLKKFDVRV